MSAPSELAFEAEYDIRARHPEHQSIRDEWWTASERARASLSCELEVAYGPAPRQRLDVFPAARSGSPLLVFIHGGYWRSNDKSNYAFLAEPYVAAGAAVVTINYGLAPEVSMAEIVEQTRGALAWLHEHAGACNADPERIHVAGHSAGGHLTAMLMTTDWPARGLPTRLVRGGCAVSGLFDLAPLIQTSINADIRLDAKSAQRLSPLLHLPAEGGPLVVAVGGEETDEFLRQSRAFAAAWTAKRFPCQHLVLPGFNHYTVLSQLADHSSALGRSVFEQMALP
jgi:arylformamidase